MVDFVGTGLRLLWSSHYECRTKPLRIDKRFESHADQGPGGQTLTTNQPINRPLSWRDRSLLKGANVFQYVPRLQIRRD